MMKKMKNKNSLTVFDFVQRKKKIIHRVTASVLLMVLVVTTCFGSGMMRDEVKAESPAKEPEEYITYVINEMKADPDRNFVILEIVPDISEGEFIYYAAMSEVTEKLSWLTQKELANIYQSLGDGDKIPNKYGTIQSLFVNDSTGTKVGGTTSNFGFKMRKRSINGQYDIKLENVFLENVIPEYYPFLKNRLEVRCLEANDVTVRDIQEADLIYINSKMHDSTKSVYEVMSTITGPGDESQPKVNRGTVPVIENFDASGTLNHNIPTYGDYEFVAYNSEEDKSYQENLTYQEANGGKELSEYRVTEKEYGGEKGYLKSRDISWDVVKEVWKLNMEGKYFPLDKEYSKVPILMDHTGIIGYKDTNMNKMVSILCTVTNDPEISAKTKAGVSVKLSGYDIIRKFITSEVKAYNPYGLRTGLIDGVYYDNASPGSSPVIKDCRKEVKKTGEDYIVSGSNWAGYLSQDWSTYDWNSQEGYKKYLSEDKEYDFGDLSECCIKNEWGGVKRWKMLNYENNTGMANYNDSMRDNYYTYNGTGALIPVNKYQIEGNIAGAEDRLEEQQGPWGSSGYTVVSVIRYLLGAKNKADFDPGSGSEKHLNILEIEPSNDFVYEDTANVAALLSDITGVSYLYDSASKKYQINTPEGSTVYTVDVSCYTVNAFNGSTEDIIAKYDIVYIGANKTVLSNLYGSVSKVYFPKAATANANDITDVKKSELEDFVNAGKILLLDTNVGKETIDEHSNMYSLVDSLGALDNVIYRISASEIYYVYDADCTPSITITSVKDAGGNVVADPQNGESASAYTTQDGINGMIDKNAILSSTGFSINYKITNCVEGQGYRTVLYIDEDNDGIYGEEQSECKYISEEAKAVTPEGMSTAELSGSLNISSVVLPDQFISGYVSWKLCVYETAEETDAYAEELVSKDKPTEKIYLNSIKRDTTEGKAAMKNAAATEKVQVNVLELVKTGTGLGSEAELEKYIAAAEKNLDYEIAIDSMAAAGFTEEKLSGKEYHLVILSTAAYNAMNAEQKSVIQKWIEADQSVLFMNDSGAPLPSDVLKYVGQDKDTKAAGAGKKASYAATLNDGQVTQYPYDIELLDTSVGTDTPGAGFETMLGYTDAAAKTTNGIVVWNTLTNGNTDKSNYFDAGYRDAVNNYYLYSMGNLMYTAMQGCTTDADRKLMVNIIIRAGSKMQWVDAPAIVVNNGILAVDGYYIYVDLDEIKETADEAVKDVLRQSNYIIDFTASNYDNGDMEGYVYWYKDGVTPVELYRYTDAGKLKSGQMEEINLTDLKTTLAEYAVLLSQIEAGNVDIRIKAINSDSREAEKKVTFKQRKVYNLK